MKASQRKRRIVRREPPIAITRLAVKPGEILIVKVDERTSAEQRHEMMRWLGRSAPGINISITDKITALAVVQPLTPEEVREIDGPLSPPPGPLAHHPV